MSTDFMKRQQLHIEKQKQFVEKSLQQFTDVPTFPHKLMKRGKGLKMELGETDIWPASDLPADAGPDNGTYNNTSEFIKRSTKNARLRAIHDSASTTQFSTGDSTPEQQRTAPPTRSRTMPPLSAPGCSGVGLDGGDDSEVVTSGRHRHRKGPRKLMNLGVNLERLQRAKDTAERAMKAKKVFAIQGPYPSLRQALRNRGWVEKFYKAESTTAVKRSPRTKKKKLGSDDDDDDEDDGDNDDDDDDGYDENTPKPWEEDNGLYGIMSRIVKNSSPNFIWCLRRDNLDFRYLRRDQMVNHYSRNGAFTTKVGLCTNLRNAHWFEDVNHESFYPRCYRLSHDEEKQMFTDDFCLTACMSVVRWVVARHREGLNKEIHSDGEDEEPPVETDVTDAEKSPRRRKRRPAPRLPMSLLDTAIHQCERMLEFNDHSDIEDLNTNEMLSLNWDGFIAQYYDLCQNGGIIPETRCRLMECEMLSNRMREIWPQFDLDGLRNIWIVKPGAQSRGRGIMCYDKLHEMLKLVDSVVRKDSKFVVQKYMERPLLVHETKFDIRQWFLVTDWNPLTIWWYGKSYLRFCKRPFTLTDFHEAIHLSNNAIQKNYEIDPSRSKEVPEDNMWSDTQFKEFLAAKGEANTWEEVIEPGMKKSIICALLTTIDIIEYRKSSFELYGADFMLTDDLQPWLIEINSSPSMCTSTPVTAELCPAVLEDTLKVVIDRRLDKGAYTGDFELLCKMPSVTIPQYLGINLQVDGNQIKSLGWRSNPKKSVASYGPDTSYPANGASAAGAGNVTKSGGSTPSSKKELGTSAGDEDNGSGKDYIDGTKKPVLKFSHADAIAARQQARQQREAAKIAGTLSGNSSSSSSGGAADKDGSPKDVAAKRRGPKRIVAKSYDTMTTVDPLARRKQGGCLLSSFRVNNEAAQARECPMCGNNGYRLAGDASRSYCDCRQDCIKINIDQARVSIDQMRFQVRNGGGGGPVSLAGNFNSTARSKVLGAMRTDERSTLIVPLSPRKLILKPPAEFAGSLGMGNPASVLPPHAIGKYYTATQPAIVGVMPTGGLLSNSVTSDVGALYRRPKKTKVIRTRGAGGASNFSSDKKAMFVLAESFINPNRDGLHGKF